MKILIHVDPKLVGGPNQRLKGIPRPNALNGACLQAHISFADTLSGPQFRWIVVQENFRMGKHHQQGFFLGQCECFALIQLFLAARMPEEEIKLPSQPVRLCRTGIMSIGHEVAIQLPERLGELIQEVAMDRKARHQFLVMAKFVYPASPTALSQLNWGASSQTSNATTG